VTSDRTASTAVVCDDEPVKRSAVIQLLDAAGYTHVDTASLPPLRALVAETAPDVVVLDLALAGMGGLDVVRHLRAASPTTAVVVLSTFTSLRADAIRAGAHALVDVHDLRGLETVLAALRTPRPRDGREDLPTSAGAQSAGSGSVSTNPSSSYDSSPPMARA
jgi:CheY-like chemotaxis protein